MNKELIIKSPNEVLQIECPQKNEYVVASEKQSISEYNEDERNTQTANLIDFLLNLLAVNEKDGNLEHHKLSFEFIIAKMSHYSFQEIVLAFQKYVAGEYFENRKPMLVTQQLNPVIIGKVMKCYSDVKREEIDRYKRKTKLLKPVEATITDEEKELLVLMGIQTAFEEYEKDGFVSPGYAWLYEYFWERKALIKHDEEYRRKTKEKALSLIKKEYQTLGKRLSGMSSYLSEAETNGKLKAYCKRIAVEDKFSEIQKSGISINEWLTMNHKIKQQ